MLLHPVGQDSSCWQWLELEDLGVTPVAVDLPGHGSRQGQPASLDEMADSAAAMLEGNFDLLGVAMGGMAAQHLLLRHPSRVRSAVLACCSGSARREVCQQRAHDAETLGMEVVLASTLERWFTAEALANPVHPGVAYARERLLAMDPYAYADMWRAMGEHQVLGALDTVSCPVTVLAGFADASVPVAAAREMQERIPGSRFEVIEAPHMAHLETPGLVIAAIARHLAWARERAIQTPGNGAGS